VSQALSDAILVAAAALNVPEALVHQPRSADG
jgi:protein-L-isoaspartate O-methyltransferase